MPEVLEIIKNVKNWLEATLFQNIKHECKYCHKEILMPRHPDYFHLWSIDVRYFITFHFRCAFKKGPEDQVNELLNRFNYRYDFKTDICY